MSRKAKSRREKSHATQPRSPRLLLACAVALAVLLLLARLLRFAHGHPRR